MGASTFLYHVIPRNQTGQVQSGHRIWWPILLTPSLLKKKRINTYYSALPFASCEKDRGPGVPRHMDSACLPFCLSNWVSSFSVHLSCPFCLFLYSLCDRREKLFFFFSFTSLSSCIHCYLLSAQFLLVHGPKSGLLGWECGSVLACSPSLSKPQYHQRK